MKIPQAVFFLFLCCYCFQGRPDKTSSVTFLVTVNDSWKYDPPISNDTCLTTVKTFGLAPDTPRNKSENIQVGNCDHGPLVYHVNENGDKKSTIFLTFYSSVIEDASPPTCTIDWNYQFRIPTQYHGLVENIDARESLLPGCSTADSREGYHMTYYWFHIFDWSLTSAADDSKVLFKKHPDSPLAVASVTFLVAVNVTGNGCQATAKSPPMKPEVSHDKNDQINVSDCDGARLNFTIIAKKESSGIHTYIDLTYWSSAYPGGGSVACTILWDYAYRNPTANDTGISPLPGCYTSFSFGGAYTVYFWFYIYDWAYGE